MASEKKKPLHRLMTFPVRALRRARDMYVRKMTTLADRLGGDGMTAAYGGPVMVSDHHLQKSFSFHASDDDGGELLKSRSARRDSGGGVRRSRSLAMERIDEDEGDK
ncbi:hypothetical protein M569_16621 [Genlisea aurea]|uniref:Uncharacterized protein n=1 Tax=Genlisea aurea TaxID=192259 RepID=S8C160_9LAMI|nr:hypothetical protein M569_16621 [Genlisea aurea]